MATIEEMMDLKKRYEEAQAAKEQSGLQDTLANVGNNLANRPSYASIMLGSSPKKVDFSGFQGDKFEKPEDIADLYSKYQEAQKSREANLGVEQMKEDRRLLERREDLGYKKEKDLSDFNQAKYLKGMDVAQKEADKHPKDMEGRLAKLNSGDKARWDNVVMGLQAVKDMDASLTGGNNTFSVIGDNNFTESQRRGAEAFGRMQSGGAINKDEEKRFIAAGPGIADSKEIQSRKLEKQKQMFEDRAKTLGFTPNEAGGGFKLTYSAPKGAGPAIPGTQDAKADGKIRVSNGSETLLIDVADLKNAETDGYKAVR